ncbi:uncharacterized protein CBL_10238 [Carabus blaptoides fortunei]
MTERTDNLSIYDFGKICRTCLAEGDMKSLYENCSSKVCLIEMLMSCTFIQLSAKDGLPVQICVNCVKELNQAYIFAKKCEDADKTLRNYISQFQSKLRKKPVEKDETKAATLRKTRSRKQNNISPTAKQNKLTADIKTEVTDDRTSDTVKNTTSDNLEGVTVKQETSKAYLDDVCSDSNSENSEDYDSDDLYVPNDTKTKRTRRKFTKSEAEIKSELDEDDTLTSREELGRICSYMREEAKLLGKYPGMNINVRNVNVVLQLKLI